MLFSACITIPIQFLNGHTYSYDREHDSSTLFNLLFSALKIFFSGNIF